MFYTRIFDQAEDLTEIKDTFFKCTGQELSYRQLDYLNPNDVLDDILKTACIIVRRGSIEKETYLLLEDGVLRIKSHIINRNYIVEEAVVSAVKNFLPSKSSEIWRKRDRTL